jgi:clan AA aspartic protease
MGLVRTRITLQNARRADLQPAEVVALVDTGALLLCVPEAIKIQLALETITTREVTTADGKKHLVPYVGPIQLTFGNRTCMTGALVMGDEPLLGAVPMEDLDLIVHPSRQEVIANPLSPNIPSALVKSVGEVEDRKSPDVTD